MPTPVSSPRASRKVSRTGFTSPTTSPVCGSSEVAQQVAMLGLDPELASGPLFGALLPALVRAARIDAVYVPELSAR